MEQRRFGGFGRRLIVSGTVATLLLGMLAVTAPVAAKQFSAWAAPSQDDLENVNTTSLEGCAMQSPDGLSLYFASNRARSTDDTRTDLDIWVAHRPNTSHPWHTPVNLGTRINSTSDELCPTPVRGKGLFFISAREGAGDIYFARLNPAHGWTTPVNLGSNVNSPTLGEAGPSYFEADGHGFLYFSSGGAANTSEIYVSEQAPDGSFGPRTAVAELNSSAFDDFRPNVRKDGLEIVFDSNRDGFQGGSRNLDIWTATRASADDPWSTPTNLGNLVNTAAREVRASFSWDGSTLYFSRFGAGRSLDIWVTTR